MTHILIRHKVADFSRVKPVYDAHLTERKKAGLSEKALLRSIDNQNDVVLLFGSRGPQRRHKPLPSHPICEGHAKAGVVGKPDIVFLS